MAKELLAPTIENTFAAHRDTVVDGAANLGDETLYEKADVNKLSKLASTITQLVARIDTDYAPTDRPHEKEKVRKGLPVMVNELKNEVTERNDTFIEAETKELFKVNTSLPNVYEIRKNYIDLLADPVAMSLILPDIDDETFDVLRTASKRPVVRKKNGVTSSVELVPFIVEHQVESELRRRRPEIAERLDSFAARKRAFNKLADALLDIVDERVNPMHGATNW